MARHATKGKADELRRKTAREAASLLYFGLEKEYRQAKLKAAERLGTRILPSNLEIAMELDQLAEETEGSARTEKLVAMRIDALELMKALNRFCPVLVGSIWRGNIRRGSDIDIEVFHDTPKEVMGALEAAGFKASKTEQMATTERGKPQSSLHVYLETTSGHRTEVVVRGVEEAGRKRTCDTFGDEIKGLTVQDLEKVLREYPNKRFLPT